MPPDTKAAQSLPIDQVLEQITDAFKLNNRVVLEAATGAGKTTRVPPALLSSTDGKIIVLEPRRVAARAAATRVADECNTELGEKVGYQIRFERRTSRGTRIVFVTEGVLLRMMQDDPFLTGVGCVVLDEFHERSLQSDTALALLRSVQESVREDLLLLVMSATFDTERLSRDLNAVAIRSEGRTYPVDVSYLAREDQRFIVDQVAAAVLRQARASRQKSDATSSEPGSNQGQGSILAFLPGTGEIRRTKKLLSESQCPLPVFELYGDLPLEQQHAVLRSQKPRIVLATNVAETSVTVDGVSVVIDSGVHRQLRFDAAAGIDRLELLPISKASADQRAGRAGRQSAGQAIRLWTESQHSARRPADPPEIRRIDFSATALYLRNLGERPQALPWLDPPTPASLERADGLLEELGACDQHGTTANGKAMAAMPLHPRLAKLVLSASERGFLSEGALLAALLSEREIFERGHSPMPTDSDILDRLDAALGLGRGGARVKRAQLRRVQQVAKQLEHGANRAMQTLQPKPPSATRPGEQPTPNPVRPQPDQRRNTLAQCLLEAFPDRLALFNAVATPNLTDQAASQRAKPSDALKDRPTGRLVGKGGVVLGRHSGVHLEPDRSHLVLCIELGGEVRRDDRRSTTVHSASLIEREWLDPARIRTGEEATFDPQTERVVGSKVTVYGDNGLVLERREGPVAASKATEVVVAAAQERPRHALGLDDDPKLAQLLLRVEFVRAHCPEVDLPTLDDDFFVDSIPMLAENARSFDALSNAARPWLQGLLSYAQAQELDRLAPSRLELPNGRTAKIEYATADEAPVLAARIQDLFGWQDTPTVASGRVPLLLHLLAPNQRPQQITDDLRGFWTGSYELVRKDLAGRYPKHPWPKDALSAAPVPQRGRARPRPKG